MTTAAVILTAWLLLNVAFVAALVRRAHIRERAGVVR